MSNRLEQEFPRTSWRVVPPVGPRGRERDVVRRYVVRGRRLRSEAVRTSLRDAAAAAACAMATLAASVRGAWPRRAATPARLLGETGARRLISGEA